MFSLFSFVCRVCTTSLLIYSLGSLGVGSLTVTNITFRVACQETLVTPKVANQSNHNRILIHSRFKRDRKEFASITPPQLRI